MRSYKSGEAIYDHRLIKSCADLDTRPVADELGSVNVTSLFCIQGVAFYQHAKAVWNTYRWASVLLSTRHRLVEAKLDVKVAEVQAWLRRKV